MVTKKKPENSGKHQGGDTRFKPGQSGNPAGRPKGSLNFATKWKVFIEKVAEANKITPEDVEQQLFKIGLERAKEGDYSFYKDIFDRVYGKATQPVEVDGRIDTQEQRVPTEAEIRATRAYEEVLIKELKGDNKGASKKK